MVPVPAGLQHSHKSCNPRTVSAQDAGGSHSLRPRSGGLPGKLWTGCLAADRKQGGPGGGSWGLPTSLQETLAAFSAVLHDVWAVNPDVNTGAVCAPIETEEGLILFFLIRDSNAPGKSSTGWLWPAQRHWTVKQTHDITLTFAPFASSLFQSQSGADLTQSAGPASLGR